MIDDVIKRLECFGITALEDDNFIINIAISKVQSSIKDMCNLDGIPQGLYNVAVDMAAGEYMLIKKSAGQLGEFDLNATVKKIDEGDAAVTFAYGSGSLTPEGRLDNLIYYLLHPGANFAAYRCIKW